MMGRRGARDRQWLIVTNKSHVAFARGLVTVKSSWPVLLFLNSLNEAYRS